jgi:rfaE bifunctional protein kinase chain/domain
MLNADSAAAFVRSFHGKHVVVVGDVMLDEYVRGDVARISPEAPVPVVDLTERSMSPGGAANAAANVVSLGGKASLVGLVGTDAQGASLRGALSARGIDVAGLVATGERPTTHKLRVVARTQQIVRVDVESRDPLSAHVEAELIATVQGLAEVADAIVISDYGKGVVSDAVARAVVSVGKKRGIPVVIDPKGRDYTKYAGGTVITPNVLELEVATGATTHNVDQAIVAAGHKLLAQLGGAALLVTRGAHGMSLLREGAEPLHVPTVARSVYDVTGAGDTVVGSLTLALAAGVPMRDALVLATHAASIAVAKVGTVAVDSAELMASFEHDGG